MLREALLAEWIMQRENVMFDSQYQKLQEEKEKNEPGSSSADPTAADAAKAVLSDAATNAFRYPSMSPPDFTGFNPEVLNKNTASLLIEIVVNDENSSVFPEVWKIRAKETVGVAAGHLRRKREHANLKKTVREFEEAMLDAGNQVSHKSVLSDVL